jgi:hypothetical protein
MHWIIQDNLYREEAYTELALALQRFEIPHDVVKVIPFTGDLPDHQQTIPHVSPTALVMVCGSTTLAKIATTRGWTPGSFLNKNHDYRVWKIAYGEHLLNHDADVCRFADVKPLWSPFFIRPCEDTKSFSGTVMDWTEFSEWQHKIIELKEKTYTSLSPDTMVSYCSLKTIRKEFRFFVVDGSIVGESVYKIGSRVIYQSLVDDGAKSFANKMIQHWQPARAFVIDIAQTDDDYKVVEINCINSAGFYAIDVVKFVMAIEDMSF